MLKIVIVSKTQILLIMKKITLLAAGIMLITGTANASEIIKIFGEEIRTRFSFNEPISFTERGIEFFVFSNGEFDFNTRPEDSQGDYYFKTAGKKRTILERTRPVNYGTLIEHDSFGRIRRIGNTFINYDGRDRVNRIGTVYMRYNRFALTQIGGLQIIYNHRGSIVDMIGSVKGRRNSGYMYNNHQQNDYDNNDNFSDMNSGGDYYHKTDKIKDIKEKEKERE